MINVMSFQQSYKRYDIMEIKWIYGQNNPADLMTKSKPFSVLKIFIDRNYINLDTIEWVKQAVKIKKKNETKAK